MSPQDTAGFLEKFYCGFYIYRLTRLWGHERRWTTSTSAFDKVVVIGRRVCIVMSTMVLKGSRIGDNSIIGARSVVSGAIAANVLAVGNPARAIRAMEMDNAEVIPS